MNKVILVLSFLMLSSTANAFVTCCNLVDSSGGTLACEQTRATTSGCTVGSAGWSCQTSGTHVGECCKNDQSQCLAKDAVSPGNLPATTSEEPKTETYWGYTNGVNKSNAGRSISAKARLDACFYYGYTTVDGLSDRSGCYTACDNTGSTMNIACQGLTGTDTCYNRCDGAFAN